MTNEFPLDRYYSLFLFSLQHVYNTAIKQILIILNRNKFSLWKIKLYNDRRHSESKK